jgi:hypothetical protein
MRPKKKKIKDEMNPSKAPVLTPFPRTIMGMPQKAVIINVNIETGKKIFIGLNRNIMLTISIIVSKAVCMPIVLSPFRRSLTTIGSSKTK